MNPKHILILMVVIMAGASLGVAAENEDKRREQRVIVHGGSPQSVRATGETSAPVTYLGVAVAPAGPALAAQLRLPEGQGLVVTLVEPDSPAAKAGLQQHDVLTKLEDQILIEPRQLSVLVRARGEGDAVNLTYLRAGAEARCTATLTTHTPAAVRHMQWFGNGGADVLFHTEEFRGHPPGPGVDGGAPQMRHLLRPHGPGMPGMPEAGERVMIFRPRAEVVVQDEGGELTVRVNEGGQVLTAKSPSGDVLFEGPITTPEQREALPAELRARLEKVEQLDLLEEPMMMPPPPAAPTFTPALPASGVGGGAVL